MSKDRLEKFMASMMDVSQALTESMSKAEDKLLEGVGMDVKKTIKVLDVMNKINKIRMENMIKIAKATRAGKLIKMVDEEGGKMYRIEGKKKGKTEWEFIFRTRDLIIADKAADKYRDEYAAVRVGEETPDGGLKPIKGRGEE
jgi:hypothetical protein